MWEFCRFEIKYRLRMISTYVFGFVMLFITVMYTIIAGGVIDDAFVGALTEGDKVAINSPYMLNSLFGGLISVSMFMLMVFIGQMFSKDFDTKFYYILFSKPVSKSQYIIGRFLGSMLLTIVIYLLCIFVFELSLLIPSIPEDILVKTQFSWYLIPMILNVLPNLYFICTLLIAVVIFTKKTSYLFISIIALMVFQGVAPALAVKIDNQLLSALIDPFGSEVISLQTKGWTSAEKNTQLVGFYGYNYLNRFIWLAISTVLLFFSWKKFSFEFSFKRKESSSNPELPVPITSQATVCEAKHSNEVGDKFSILNSQLLIFWSAFILNLKMIFKSPAFYWLTAISITMMVTNLIYGGMVYGTKVLPVTYMVTDSLFSGSFLFMLIMITYFTGELVWAARDSKFNMIEDCLPINTFHSFFSKFLAMLVMLAGFAVLQVLIGIIFQTCKGYFNYQIGVYLQASLLVHFINVIVFLLMAFFVQNILNNKYAAHFALILGFLAIPFLHFIKIEHRMLTPFSTPYVFYSDMSGWGNNVPAFVWFNLYWFLWLLLIIGSTIMTWKVGVQQRYFKNYLKKLKTKPALIYNISVIILLAMVSGFVFYNTNKLHTYHQSKFYELRHVDYEKRYSHHKKANQPKIQDIVLNVALYPDDKRMVSKGKYLLKNIGTTAIDTLLIHYDSDYDLPILEFFGDNIPELVTHDKKNRLFLMKLNEGMAPGDSLIMTFDITHAPKGFSESGSRAKIYQNGTFVNSQIFPAIGYDANNELSTDRMRKKYGLPEQDIMPAVDDPWGLSKNYVSSDADWISYEITVSTSADQTALAPGELVNHWTEDNRNYYTYKINENALHFYSILSAKYEVHKGKYGDIDLEIYYHMPHTFNLDDMMESLKASLEYYTNAFGPYRYSILRIAEFPRWGSFAQAFPTLIPFSEGVGFIADLKKDTINYAYYITAHETSHQWWAHQLIGGFNRGSIMLTESFTEYASLMVVKKRFSDKLYREQLRYAMDQYLSGRSMERKYELPMTQLESQQYLIYNKGNLVMNATSRLLGENVLSAAMREFMDKYRFTANPYPNSTDFMKVLDPYVPDSLKTTIDDMFNKIVLFDHKITKFNTEGDDGAYLTSVEFTTEKRYYDEKGKPEIVDFEGWLEIAFVDKNNEILHLDKLYITQKENKYVFVTPVKPNNAVIDPYFLTLHLTPLESGGNRSVSITISG